MDCSRRTILAGGASALVLAPALLRAAAATASSIASAPVAEGVTLFTGAGGNAVAAVSGDALLMIDGGHAQSSAALLDAVFATTSLRRVHTLINTHWHPDQTGSNLRLGRGGTKLVAHENTKLWLGTDAPLIVPDVNHNTGKDTLGPLAPQGRPTQSFYTSDKIAFGAQQAELGYLLEAHTDGDAYVFLRERNVLVAGGAVSNDRWPVVDYLTGGWITGMSDGVQALLKVGDANTRIVPANGPVMSRAELVAYGEMLAKINAAIVKSLRSGLSPEEAVAANPTRGFKPEWGDPSQFVTFAFKSLWPHLAPDS